MSKIFGDIKSQLQGVLKIKDVNSDNFVFKLFYKATFALLIGAAGNFWLLRYTYSKILAILAILHLPIHFTFKSMNSCWFSFYIISS